MHLPTHRATSRPVTLWRGWRSSRDRFQEIPGLTGILAISPRHPRADLKADELFRRKDGSSFHAEFMITPIYENDRIVGVVGTFRDITERKQGKVAQQ